MAPVLRHSLSCFCVSHKSTQLSIRSHGRHNLTGHSDSQSHEHTCTGSHRCTHTLLTHLHRHTLTCTFAHSNTCVHSHSLTEHTHALALTFHLTLKHTCSHQLTHISTLTQTHSLTVTLTEHAGGLGEVPEAPTSSWPGVISPSPTLWLQPLRETVRHKDPQGCWGQHTVYSGQGRQAAQ